MISLKTKIHTSSTFVSHNLLVWPHFRWNWKWHIQWIQVYKTSCNFTFFAPLIIQMSPPTRLIFCWYNKHATLHLLPPRKLEFGTRKIQNFMTNKFSSTDVIMSNFLRTIPMLTNLSLLLHFCTPIKSVIHQKYHVVNWYIKCISLMYYLLNWWQGPILGPIHALCDICTRTCILYFNSWNVCNCCALGVYWIRFNFFILKSINKRTCRYVFFVCCCTKYTTAYF